MDVPYNAASQPSSTPMRTCWVDQRRHLLSFHEVIGYKQEQFSSRLEEWIFVQNKLDNGYLVQ